MRARRKNSSVPICIGNSNWPSHLWRLTNVFCPQVDWNVGILNKMRPEQNVDGQKPLKPTEVEQPHEWEEACRINKAVLSSNLWVVVLDHCLRMRLKNPVNKEMDEDQNGK